MAYIVQADIVPRRLTSQELIELTDDAKTGEVDATLVTDICAEASGVVDSYCRGRYVLPLTVSEQVKGLALDIAVYKLFGRRRRENKKVEDAHTDAIKFLKDVADGRASLDQSGKVQSSEMDVVTKDHSTDPDVFDDDELEAY